MTGRSEERPPDHPGETTEAAGGCDASGQETAPGGVRYTPLGLLPAFFDHGYIF